VGFPPNLGQEQKGNKQVEIDFIARNLACVEQHFHGEADNQVEDALDLYTEDIPWAAPAL
jgi:hypothetical protein